MSKTIAKKINDKEEFVVKIIHDLKTPINAQAIALKFFLSAVQNKITQEEKDLINLTLNSCEYMQKLIDVFTSVDKLKNNKLILHYERFNVAELIYSIVNELNVLLKYYELNVVYNVAKDVFVKADKLQIKRVLENLISNGINYAYKNTTIEVDSNIKDNQLVFKLQNKSPYIEPKILKEMFKKYKTNISAYNKNSVGLGLYLSQEIIKAHHGKMIAKSFEDDINVFGFVIPLK